MSFEISVPGASFAKNAGARRRQLRAVEKSVAAFEHLLEEASPEELEILSERVEGALSPVEAPTEKIELAARITGGKTYTASERAGLEAAALARSFALRREVLAGSLSAPDVATLLGTSRQTPHDRTRAGTLLGILDRGALRFPAWQFDPQGEDGVVAGLPEVLGALRLSHFGKAYWLSRPNPYLADWSPIEVLRDGDLEAVKSLAESVGAV